MATLIADPFEVFTGALLKERSNANSPEVKPILRDKLVTVAGGLLGHKIHPLAPPSMALTARHPYDAAGFMDAYQPGRWDCESNLVFMDVIRQIGPSPGEWDGTVVYARFTAPSNSTFLVVGNFSGYQITLNLHGPWGNNTAYCPTTADHAQALAFWDGTAGQTLFFTINLTGPIIGYLESVQVYAISW